MVHAGHTHAHEHNYLIDDDIISANERKTLIVVIVSSAMMLVEIIAGYLTSSMALLADGWHMASHAGALSISYLAYKLARSKHLNGQFSFGAGKFIPLGGYTSAIILAIVALLMAFMSIERLFLPVSIKFNEAIVIAVLGLIVNFVCALILFDKHHHDHDHGHTHDHNAKSAYAHVLADGMTSIFAIVALTLGKYLNLLWLDAIMGVIGASVILVWAFSLCKETLWELMDGQSKAHHAEDICRFIEATAEVQVCDLHIWRIAPNAHACELVLISTKHRGSVYYKTLIQEKYHIDHLVVEELLR
ncbi:MAG: hypothetical protein A2X86_21860 [Bdellovibrionales bacterium GWA2_49_15]|nr:MAG: hypothetical protein A2X86_21860 [Bdellovibrionales bacterium GWA2_49_15]